MHKRNMLAVIAVVCLITLLGACGPAKGSVEVYVTDALPKEVSAVEIKAADVQVHKADAAEDSWITVLEDPPVFDLVKIAGVNVLLGTSELASGNYTQVRLDITGANVTVNGNRTEAIVPSGTIRLVGSFAIEENKNTSITLDFDGEKSVILTGNNRALIKPTIKLIIGEPGAPVPATSNTTATQ